MSIQPRKLAIFTVISDALRGVFTRAVVLFILWLISRIQLMRTEPRARYVRGK